MGGKLWVHQGEAQGTTYTIKYVAQDSVPQQAIDDELERVDVEMNAWRPESALSRFNAFSRTDTVFEVRDVANVWGLLWDISSDVHAESRGAFDVAMAPLMKLWGFRTEHRDVVTQAMVDSVHAFARFRTDVVDFNEVLDDDGQKTAGHLSKGDPRVSWISTRWPKVTPWTGWPKCSKWKVWRMPWWSWAARSSVGEAIRRASPGALRWTGLKLSAAPCRPSTPWRTRPCARAGTTGKRRW